MSPAVAEGIADVRRALASTLVGRRWKLDTYPHPFTVLALTMSGKAEVRDGRVTRYLDAADLVAARASGDMVQVPHPRELSAAALLADAVARG